MRSICLIKSTLLAGVASATLWALPQAASGQDSVARQWCEVMLEAIRGDFARPPVHARNLYHVSAAMHDAWGVYDVNTLGYLVDADRFAENPEAARAEAISYAAYRILQARFSTSPSSQESLAAFDALMNELGYDTEFYGTAGDTPAAWGNRIAFSYLVYGLNDGANELGDYENLYYTPSNPPMVVQQVGNPTLDDPDRWQPLTLDFFVDQSGNVIPGATPPFLGAEWGIVSGFALTEDDFTIYERGGELWPVAHDPGAPPSFADAEYKHGFEMVANWSSHCDPTDGVIWDISPNSIGNATLPATPAGWDAFYDVPNGGDSGTGYSSNPVTGQAYAPQLVPRGDFTRALAEFWADGPDSETPPGHWMVILNSVSDDLAPDQFRIGGEGEVVDRLQWDIKSYFALAGCMHDAAISAWGAKGWYDFIRPVSAIRWMASKGQCSNPAGASYDPDGINLVTDLIEVISSETTAPGERHAHLLGFEGQVAIKAWRGPDFITDPEVDQAGVDWVLGNYWWPYQRPTFVTPNFAGYVSGHSTYSRAAAELLTSFTGSPYFPGGMGEFVCTANEFLVFEEGPSVDVRLQWVTYRDASDQCSLSRIWGGIHPRCDDIPGRNMGQIIGPAAWEKAASYWLPPELCPQDFNDDGVVDGADLVYIIAAWGLCLNCTEDLTGDGVVNGLDLAVMISSWGQTDDCGQ